MKVLLITLAFLSVVMMPQACSAFASNKLLSLSSPPRVQSTALFDSEENYFDDLDLDLDDYIDTSSFHFQPPKILNDGEPFSLAAETFKGAITYAELLKELRASLIIRGYHFPQTLCATSLDCDESNRPLENALQQIFNANYNLGGIAGCPFGGVTSFRKMKEHIPDGGSCVIVYGSRVGISSKGNVGITERENCQEADLCCRSAILAADYVGQVYRGERELAPPPMDPIDAGQYFVGNMLMPHAERLEKAEDPMIELPYALYEEQRKLMLRIIEEGSKVGLPGRVALLGGIQINTPPGKTDYFVPMNYEIYNARGGLGETIL